MTDFRTHKARTDAALPTPAWSVLDRAPDRHHRNEVAEFRGTFAGSPFHYVASVTYGREAITGEAATP